MNLSRDAAALEQLEYQIESLGTTKSFSQLNGFPFNDLNELRNARDENRITLGINHTDFNSILTFGKPSDKNQHIVSLVLGILVMVGIIVYSIYMKNYFLLIGIICWFCGFGLSRPYCAAKSLIGLVLLLFIGSFFILETNYSILLGVTLLSYFFLKTNLDITVNSIIDNSLNSEKLFSYLFKDLKMIAIKDNSSNIFLNADDY